MASLLTKFRIKYSELIMLKGVSDTPKPETLRQHKQLIDSYCFHARSENPGITNDEIEEMVEKTNRQLRVHEMVVEHSSEAALIVMSLPMPRRVSEINGKYINLFLIRSYFFPQEAISAPLYMSWLEMLSSDVKCPVLMARGNQTPVLTLYS